MAADQRLFQQLRGDASAVVLDRQAGPFRSRGAGDPDLAPRVVHCILEHCPDHLGQVLLLHRQVQRRRNVDGEGKPAALRSEEHTSELQSLMRISYAVFCLQQKNFLLKVSTVTAYVEYLYMNH